MLGVCRERSELGFGKRVLWAGKDMKNDFLP